MNARDYRRIAREKLEHNWLPSIAVTFVAALLGGTLRNGGFSLEVDQELLYHLPDALITVVMLFASFSGILSLVQMVLGGTVQLGYAQYLLKQHDRKPRGLEDLFSQFHRIGTGFCQAFLRGLYTFLWSLLLIIPGIVAAYSYAMTPFILAEHPEMTASQAITASKELMDGHKADLFWLDLSFFGWSLLASLTLGLGYLVLDPYMNAAHAAFYADISSHKTIYDAEPVYEYIYE